MTRGKRLLARLGLLCGSLLLVFAVGEVFVRLFLWSEVDPELLAESAPDTRSFTRASQHPGLVFELRPAVDVVWHNTRVVIDDQGYSRIPPVARTPGASDRRLAIVGDSSAFGWGVEYAETYGAVLVELLEARGVAAQVRNFAVPGNNSSDNLVSVRDRVLPWAPDLIVVHYDHNDAEPAWLGQAMDVTYGDNPLGSALLKLISRRWYTLKLGRLSTAAFSAEDDPNLSLGYFRHAGPQYESHMERMQQLARLAAAADVPVIVFIFNPWLEATADRSTDEVYTRLHRPAVERLGKLGYLVVDSYGPMQAKMRAMEVSDLKSTWVTGYDAHPSVAHHREIAALLLQALTADASIAGRFGLSGP